MSRKNYQSSDKVFYGIIYVALAIITLLVLYPLIYIVSSSFSSGAAVSSGKVVLWPVDFSLEGYNAVFKNKDIGLSFLNSVFYTVAGTVINVVVTMVCAYPLARKKLPAKGIFTFLITFTMLFSGGMIPSYILLKDLHMLNTRWALLIPGALGVTNLIITRTFLQSNIPDDILEAAQIDGCNDYRFFISMVLPLSKAVIAVISLYYAVGHWNEYFSAFLYLNDPKLYPLQLVLRDILVANSVDPNMVMDAETVAAKMGLSDLLKYSLIVISSLPVILVYPFVQKFFVKGVMVGSLKG